MTQTRRDTLDIAALLFSVVAARIFWGEPLLPTATPLPLFAYPVLVLTFVGWIATLLNAPGPTTATGGASRQTGGANQGTTSTP